MVKGLFRASVSKLKIKNFKTFLLWGTNISYLNNDILEQIVSLNLRLFVSSPKASVKFFVFF